MHKQENRKNIRKMALSIDVANIVIGLIIVAMSVVSFLNPKDHMLLLPIIFLLGAFLSILNGIHGFHRNDREVKKKLGAILQCALGIFLLGICALSMFSIGWK